MHLAKLFILYFSIEFLTNSLGDDTYMVASLFIGLLAIVIIIAIGFFLIWYPLRKISRLHKYENLVKTFDNKDVISPNGSVKLRKNL